MSAENAQRPLSILDRLPSDGELREWMQTLQPFRDRQLRIEWKGLPIQSPDTFTMKVESKELHAWVKFSMPEGVEECRVYQDLASSSLPMPEVVGAWNTDLFHCVVLSDRPGINLMEDPDGLAYLSSAAQKLAELQAYWLQSGVKYGCSSFSYLDEKGVASEKFGTKARWEIHNAWRVMSEVPIILTHGDSIPANWLRGQDGVGPLDFKEVTRGHCLMDLLQLLDPAVWAESDPAGNHRRNAVWVYTSAMNVLGLPTPWKGREDEFFQAAMVIHRVRMMQWIYRQRLKWHGHPDARIHPFFTADPNTVYARADQSILQSNWDPLFL